MNYKYFIFLFVTGCLVYNGIYYVYGGLDWALVPFSIISTSIFVKRFDIWNNLCLSLLLATVFLSVVFVPTFQFAGETFSGGNNSYIDYQHLSQFGNKIFCEFSVLSALLIYGRGDGSYIKYYRKPLSSRTINGIFIVALLCLAFGTISGSMYMGAAEERDRIVLPFHLNGVINIFTITVLPYIFAIIIENEILTRGKIEKKHIYFFIIFGIISTFVRLSKAALVAAVLPFGLVLFIYYRPRLSTIIKYLVPILIIILTLYPIVQTMRHTSVNQSLSERIFYAYIENEENEKENNDDNVIITSFNRQFMSGGYYMKYYKYLNQDQFFDFSRAPLIVAAGGGAGYITHVIDGYMIGSGHSAGTTGSLDAIMFGGYGFCYLVMLFIPFLASFFDAKRYRNCITFRIIGAFFTMSLFNTGTISRIVEITSIMYTIGIIFSMFLALRINFRAVKAHRIISSWINKT